MTFRFRRTLAAAFACSLAVALQASAASRVRPITKPKYDPAARKVELFEGMKDGTLETKLIFKNAQGGRLLVTNKTDKPVTVQLPKSFVGVQVLKQFQGGGGPMGPGGGLGPGGGAGQGQGQGGQQPGGGGFGGGQGQGGQFGQGGGGGGGNFFSIPPEKIVAVPFGSVCLAHGKPEPSPRSNYRIIPVEEFTKDRNLQVLIEMVGTGRLNQRAAQAAVWHLTDKMSWRRLAAKRRGTLGQNRNLPYFAAAELYTAQRIVATAVAKAKEQPGKKTVPVNTTPRRRRFVR